MSLANQRAAPFLNPLCVALDVDDAEKALRLVDELKDFVGGFKVGPRLVYRYGADFVKKISTQAPVFVDCKFFDIPSTMEAAVQAAFEAGASLVTVHALAGFEALSRLAKLEAKLNQDRPFRILSVTILTSWSQGSLPPSLKEQDISQHVLELAGLVEQAGLKGLVCSAEELPLLKDKGLYKVTPGIRFTLDDRGDQKRVMSPADAMKGGSSLLVVGRPILESKSPREAASDFLTAIYE